MLITKIPAKITAIQLFEGLKKLRNPIFLDSSISESAGKLNSSGYSIIFVDPFLTFSSKNKGAFKKLKGLLNKYKIKTQSGTGFDFPLGAAAGYISYDAGLLLEKIKTYSRDELNWPAMEFGFYDCVIVYNHAEKQIYLVSTGLPETKKEKAREKAKRRRDYFLDKIKSIQPEYLHAVSNPQAPHGALKSNFTKSGYINAINKIKKYIEAGDVYQVNLSRKFYTRASTDPYLIYKKIRQYNKVPFGAYLKFSSRELLSFSMERFLKIFNNEIETRPIKGTMPRGRTPQEDKKIAQELLSSRKNLAELLMITDLERNDLGRVCDYGSIHVEKLHEIEKYATVFHLVSTIKGRLHKHKTHLDCFKACFPGGSITGTPKIRSMEIIDELEKIKRNVYCGCIGYFGFNNLTDFNIAIRTIHAHKGRLYFNSGGGITFDSDPALEYEETIHKVKTFLDIL